MAGRQKVVVTGAFGYIGLALTRRLVRDYQVVAVGHPPRAQAPIPAGVEVVEGDVMAAAEHLGPQTLLVHLAGGGGEEKCRQDPVTAVRNIVRGTSSLAQAARDKGTSRMLYASTIVVYGTHRDHGRPYTETDKVEPDDLYGTLKEAAEHIWTTHGGGTALRLANVYGAGVGVDLGIRGVCERFALQAAAGERLTIYGEGDTRLDLVHVDDVCEAFARALGKDGPLPKAINVGTGEPITIRAIAEAACSAGQALGASPTLGSVAPPEGKTWPERSLDIGLARRLLVYAPSVSLADGMKALTAMMQNKVLA